MTAKRILFIANHASLGDVHVFVAIGQALQHAGHTVTVAVSEDYVPVVSAAGLCAVPVGAPFEAGDPSYWDTVFENLLDIHRGPLRYLPSVCASAETWLEQSLDLARDADLIIAGPQGVFVPTLAELSDIPWVHVATSPSCYWSAFDPPDLLRLPVLRDSLSAAGYRGLQQLLFRVLSRAGAPLHATRVRRGLSRGPRLLDDRYSPWLNLAAFSRQLSPPQLDWPAPFAQVGCLHYDGATGGKDAVSAELGAFLESGPAPVLLTLGAGSAVFRPGAIYDAFAEVCARRVDLRGVLLVGDALVDILRSRFSSPQLFVSGYVPYDALFPRCRAVIHHGGAGATGRALSSGVPSLVIGHAEDHRDNGRLLQERALGLTLRPGVLSDRSLERTLDLLLQDTTLAHHARHVAAEVNLEDGARASVQAIERLLHARAKPVASEQRARSNHHGLNPSAVR